VRKVIFLSISILMTLGIMAGCAGNKELIKEMSTSTTQGVFQEIEENVQPVHGYADLRIYSSLKTHNPGIYSAKDIHGTPDYMLLLNIDGQAILLLGSLQKENCEPRKLVEPEKLSRFSVYLTVQFLDRVARNVLDYCYIIM